MSNEEYLLRSVELPPELVIFNNVLDKIQSEFQGADFTIGHELEINAAKILYSDYDPNIIEETVAYNSYHLLTSYIFKRFNKGNATFVSEDFDILTPTSTNNSPVWDELYTKALDTHHGVINEFNVTIQDIYFSTRPKDHGPFKAWQAIGYQLLKEKKNEITIINGEEDPNE